MKSRKHGQEEPRRSAGRAAKGEIKPSRQERQAEALRENLRRRKEQQRARASRGRGANSV